MSPRNPSVVAARLTLAGAALLIASLFVTWVKLPGQQGGATSLDGWTVLESGDTLLLFIALIAIGLVASRNIRGPWLLVLGIGAFSVVLPFLLSSVPLADVYEQVYTDAGYSYDPAKGNGVWIAAAGTTVLLIAGFIQVRERKTPASRRPKSRDFSVISMRAHAESRRETPTRG